MRVLVSQIIDGQSTKPIEVSLEQLAQVKLLRASLTAKGLSAIVITPKGAKASVEGFGEV